MSQGNARERARTEHLCRVFHYQGNLTDLNKKKTILIIILIFFRIYIACVLTVMHFNADELKTHVQ